MEGNPGTSPTSPVGLVAVADASRVVLRGLGQVMFQRHAGTGLLFLIGMALASLALAAAAAVGAVIGPLVAVVLRLPRDDIEDGIYGYNSALVAAAAVFFLGSTPVTWGLAMAGAVVAVPLAWLLKRWLPQPAFTAAFVLVAWGLLLLAGLLGQPRVPTAPPPALPPGLEGFFVEVFAGVAEVMFSARGISGLCFLIGIGLSSWRQAVIAMLGAVLGTLAAVYHGDPAGAVASGLYGFNAALAAMAVCLTRPSLVAASLAALVSVPLVEFFPASLGVPSLTAPFIIAAWIVLGLLAVDRMAAARQDTGSLHPTALGLSEEETRCT